MIGSVHGCVSCPVVVKPWEPHPLPLPQPHRQPSPQPSSQTTPYPFSQRSSSVHPLPHVLTQDSYHDTRSQPRTSSPKFPKEGEQEQGACLSDKQRQKAVSSAPFSHQLRHGYDVSGKKEQSALHLNTSLALESSTHDDEIKDDNKGYGCEVSQTHQYQETDLLETVLSQHFRDNTAADTSLLGISSDDYFEPKRETQPSLVCSEESAIQLHKGTYKSTGTQTLPVPSPAKTKHNSLTQTGSTSAEAVSKAQTKVSRTKAPLRSAWKPDENLVIPQQTLGRRLPALPKPKPLKLQFNQLPRQPSNLSQKQAVKKKSSDVKRKKRKDSISNETEDSLASVDPTHSEESNIKTPAWLRQLTLPSFPTSPFHWAASGSNQRSRSISYETSESESQHNFEIASSPFDVKPAPPAQESFESATIQSSESDWSSQPKVSPEVDALTTAAAAGDTVVVKKLLQNEVDVNATNSFGRTAIQVMIHDNPDLAEILMKAGADPNTCDVGKKAANSTFRTIAHDVAASGYTDTLRCLLRHGADVNLQDRWGNTPLHLAAKAGYLQAVRLLRRGTSLYTPNHQGRTPIDILEEQTDPAIHQWVQLKKTNASRLQTLCILAIRKELGAYGLRCWCRHAPDSAIQRQVLLQSRSSPPNPSASTLISNHPSAGSKSQKLRGHGSTGNQTLMAALTSRQLLDFLTLRDLIPRRLSSGENTSLEVQNTSSVHSSDDVLSLGPHAASSLASDNGSLFDANLSSIDASHSTNDDVSLPSFDQSL